MPGHRRKALGQALHDRLLDGVKRRCLLNTSDDPEDDSVRLYNRSGWRKLGTLMRGVQGDGPRPDLSRETDRPSTKMPRARRNLCANHVGAVRRRN